MSRHSRAIDEAARKHCLWNWSEWGPERRLNAEEEKARTRRARREADKYEANPLAWDDEWAGSDDCTWLLNEDPAEEADAYDNRRAWRQVLPVLLRMKAKLPWPTDLTGRTSSSVRNIATNDGAQGPSTYWRARRYWLSWR